MGHTPARRALGVAVAALTSTVAVLTGIGTATAAPAPVHPTLTVQTPTPTALYPAPSKGAAPTAQPNVSLDSNVSTLPNDTDLTLTIDARGLAKFAHVTFGSGCVVKGLIATCDQGVLPTDIGSGTSSSGAITLSALKGAPEGASGSYTISGTTTTGVGVVSSSGTVTVGGPEFDLTAPPNHSNVALGSNLAEPIKFTNAGTRPSNGVQVILLPSAGLDFTTRYSNCRYGSAETSPYLTDLAICSISGLVRVGETAELAVPVGLHVDQTALYSYLDSLVDPLGYTGDNSWVLPGHTWKQGTGAKLGLKVLAAGVNSTAPAGTAMLLSTNGESSNYQIASVSARNTDDFGVTGAAAKGAKGQTAKFTFSLVDHGPATLYDRSGGEDSPSILVTPPPGTTIVGSSAACQPSLSNDPTVTAHGPYLCSAGYYFVKGEVNTFTLTVRVDTVTAGAKGSVKIQWGEGINNWRPPYDTNPRDDSAVLTLN
jgi:hypothetical protein